MIGLPIPLITITAHSNGALSSKREGIVITSRVHPGETNASYVFEGLLNYLTSFNFYNWQP